MKKHIIFDFDDTISSAYEHNQQLFVETFLSHDSNIDQTYLRTYHYANRGKSMLKQFEAIITELNLNLSPTELEEENELLHQLKSDDVEIFDEFENILKHFKGQGKTISLCTNRAEASLRKILTKNNLEHYFDNMVSCRDAKREKPDPFCLLGLMEKYPHITKDETIYFGDSKTDAEFAEGAGIDYLVIDHYLNRKQFYKLVLTSFASS